MLGLGDIGIFSAYVLCVLSAIACLIYGIFNWNKGAADENEQKKELDWQQKEHELSEKIDI